MILLTLYNILTSEEEWNMRESAPESGVFYLFENSSVFIKLINRFTALHGVGFRALVEDVLLNNSGVQTLYLDLSEAQYLDSTFMGTLVHVKNKSDELEKNFKVVNPSKEVLENLKSLGLEKILKIEDREETFKKSRMKEFPCYSAQKNQIFRSILKSHILLSNINKDNKKEFCSLLKRLKKESRNR
ncbi:STAS domain-containing protein [Borrelia sp. P9F1]|uniref:STAS domain-containing protein n=1 Tax=Borrelia sp. P9F1 TaxID=3058374 RepID=UPI0026473878|nr:STAS domain-containing protein [Borrelia sp. P9F1]WKC58330.1 STAS domain-containing protein [Borrelia sp. P9F1]